MFSIAKLRVWQTSGYRDHKPLFGVFNKQLDTAPPPLQRMLLQLQRYDFKLIYKPGKELYIADTLSRTCQQASEAGYDTTEDDPIKAILTVVIHSEKTRESYREATRLDQQLQDVLVHVKSGWHSSKKLRSACSKIYWDVRT